MKIFNKKKDKKIALVVTQIGKVNATFTVTNPKKFEKWRNLARMEQGLTVQTLVKEIELWVKLCKLQQS